MLFISNALLVFVCLLGVFSPMTAGIVAENDTEAF